MAQSHWRPPIHGHSDPQTQIGGTDHAAKRPAAAFRSTTTNCGGVGVEFRLSRPQTPFLQPEEGTLINATRGAPTETPDNLRPKFLPRQGLSRLLCLARWHGKGLQLRRNSPHGKAFLRLPTGNDFPQRRTTSSRGASGCRHAAPFSVRLMARLL
jgi:hypothetical protein